jgi:hypothetical protein
VGVITEVKLRVKFPTLEVAATPVGNTKFCIADVKDPTLDVVLNPAG